MQRFTTACARPRAHHVLLAITTLALALAGSAAADGPVAPGALPGGATVFDTDPFTGEQWGRAGGRDLDISANDPALFTALSWGVVAGTAPGAAFDGAINAVGETMAFDAGSSNLPAGIAVWAGSATIHLADTNTNAVLDTRFTLTVTNPGAVPMAFVLGGVNPGIDVLGSGPFSANLLFEAFYPAAIGGDNTWRPLLDLFDLLETDTNVPGGGGLAQTGVNTAFYFEAVAGLTLEDHDDNISNQIAAVKSDTAFLRVDAINRLAGLGVDLDDLTALVQMAKGDLTDVKDQVGMIPKQDLSNEIAMILALLQGDGGGDPATSEDIQSLQDGLTEILLILFGLAPCPPEAGPVCEQATFVGDLATADALAMAKDEIQEKLELLQATLDAVPVSPALEVEVVDISQGNPHERQWLVKTTRDGARVDAVLTTLLLMRTSHGGVPTAQDVLANAGVTPVALGVQEVYLPLTNDQKKELRALLFELSVEGDAPAVGSMLVDSHKNADDD